MTTPPQKKGCLKTPIVVIGLGGLIVICALMAYGGSQMEGTTGTEVAAQPTNVPSSPTIDSLAATMEAAASVVVPTAAPLPSVEPIREQQTLAAQVNRRIFLARDYPEDEWPFTVDEVMVQCLPGRLVVIDGGGTRYGLNGTSQRDYPKFDPIWKDHPSISGMKINVGPFLNEGLTLCR